VYVWSTQYFLHGGWSLVASGFGILLLLIILPEGLGGLLYEIRDRLLRLVAFRRGISVPGVVNETSRPAEADAGALAVLEELATDDDIPTTTIAVTKAGP
jgi:hypothetical protein